MEYMASHVRKQPYSSISFKYWPYTVGRTNFEDKKFRGFHGYLLNLEIKYLCNFLYTRSRFFVQHVDSTRGG